MAGEQGRPRDWRLDLTLGHQDQYTQDFTIGVVEALPIGVRRTIWDAGTDFEYTPFVSAVEVFVTSTNTGDTTQTVVVAGLDLDFLPKSTPVTLNGQTAVSAGTFRHVAAVVVVAGVTPLGDLYASTAGSRTAGVPDDNTTVKTKVLQGKNISRNGFFMCPAGFVAATVATRGTANAAVSIPKCTTETWIHLDGSLAEFNTVQQNSTFANQFAYPVSSSKLFGELLPVIDEKTLVIWRAISNTNNTDVFFGSDVILIPKSEVRLGPVVES